MRQINWKSLGQNIWPVIVLQQELDLAKNEKNLV